jgi:hypothetical protein
MTEASIQSGEIVKLFTLDENIDLSAPEVRREALETVEGGGVVFLPKSGFQLTQRERELISNTKELLVKQPKKRNGRPTIVFDPARGRIMKHFAMVDGKIAFALVRSGARPELEAMMARFAAWADDLVTRLFPTYHAAMVRDRVTYRPNARDSTQPLHVDSSYGFPTQGRSMFRLFCNIDPENRPRIWQVGEPFQSFVARYMPSVHVQKPGWSASLLSQLGIVGPKTAYDQVIAELRRLGKDDKEYQKNAPRKIVEFPTGSCWFAITDLVLHGAVSGQHSIDQTYFLPETGMSDPAHSTLRILERMTQRSLV